MANANMVGEQKMVPEQVANEGQKPEKIGQHHIFINAQWKHSYMLCKQAEALLTRKTGTFLQQSWFATKTLLEVLSLTNLPYGGVNRKTYLRLMMT